MKNPDSPRESGFFCVWYPSSGQIRRSKSAFDLQTWPLDEGWGMRDKVLVQTVA
ncbi:MAG: hypothetical protein L0G87_00180 [Renibacterium salmoninarum]|nr:hypothetical protein [Renibacterium salmoninarum]